MQSKYFLRVRPKNARAGMEYTLKDLEPPSEAEAEACCCILLDQGVPDRFLKTW